MVLIRCEPLADQAPMILQQRLQYLMMPRFKQVLVSTYQQQCVALIPISLVAYNQNQFKLTLQQITKQADCRLIVSQHYVNPEDTFAAYTVCERTAQLKTGRGRVIFVKTNSITLRWHELITLRSYRSLLIQPYVCC